MIPEITTLPAPNPAARLKTVIAKDGVVCRLLTLAPGHATSRHEARDGGEQILIVLDGQATVRMADVSTILNPEGALFISAASAYSIEASAPAGARLLRIDLPRRGAGEPVIYSFDR